MDWVSIGAILLSIVAIVLAIIALAFGGKQGPQGIQGQQGPPGNNGTNGGPITTDVVEAIYDPSQNCYVLPPVYNGYNILIPQTVPPHTNNIKIDASQVKNGDVFTIDNTQNPDLFLYIQISGFDNDTSSEFDEIVLNYGYLNRNNTALINITVGKTIDTKNIFVIINDL